MASGYRVCCCLMAGTAACYNCSNNNYPFGYYYEPEPIKPIFYPTPNFLPANLDEIIKRAVEEALREHDMGMKDGEPNGD